MEYLALMIPILGLSIPIVAIIAGTKAKRYKYMAQNQEAGKVDALEARIQQLEETISNLTTDVDRIEDKQQFISRLLEEK